MQSAQHVIIDCSVCSEHIDAGPQMPSATSMTASTIVFICLTDGTFGIYILMSIHFI